MRTPLPPHVVEAILVDYKADIPVREIGRRHGVSYQSVCKYANRVGLHRPQAKGKRPPESPCRYCSKVCRSVERTCRWCRLEMNQVDPRSDGPTGLNPNEGRWVFDPFRRVQVLAPWNYQESA